MPPFPSRASLRSHVPWRRAALVLGLLAVTLVATVTTAHTVKQQEGMRFRSESSRLDAALDERLTAYVQVLRGAVGLFQASDRVTRGDWDTYVTSLQLDERYPGFKSLSFAQAVRTRDLDAYVASVRSEVLPDPLGPPDALVDYAIRDPDGSSGSPELHGPIRYVAPFSEVNRLVLGVDMMAEPTRRAVMLRAARTDRAVASTRLHLAGSTDEEAGFIVYVPVRRDGVLLGWVTAAFLAEAFAEGLDEARGTALDVELTDGPGGSGAVLFSSRGTGVDGSPIPLGDSGSAPFESVSAVQVPGGEWSIRHVAPPDFVPLTGRLSPAVVALLGLLATLMLWVLATGRSRWRRQAALLEAQAVGLDHAREVAESASRATEAFLATMTHEIRTPLHAVVGASRLLQDTDLDADQREAVRVIGGSGDHLLQVVNKVLDYSRLEADGIELEHEPFDPAVCVRSALDLVAGEARARSQRLETDLDLPPLVVGDASRLRQVLVNLLANAVRFTPEGGEVRVRGRRIGADTLELEVSDTGVGIPAELQARLFDPFVQAQASTTRTHGGTGLGLSIARRLVVAMGGDIEVESEVDAGATFRFRVRTPAAPEQATAAGPEPGGAERALRVLVAEDDEANQMLVERMLRRLGHDPEIVGDGAAAVDAVRRERFDVVFLDLHMPVLDGVDAAREIERADTEGERPYLVAMTGSVSPSDLEAAHDAGMTDVVTKPFVQEDLAAALTRASLRLNA